MRLLILFSVILTCHLFAQEVMFECTIEEVAESYPRNTFLTETHYSIPSKVDPITGQYYEEECDLVIAAITPLSLRRFYYSNAPYDSYTADWRYFPESFCVANLEWDKEKCFVSVGEREGVVHPFCLKESSLFHFDSKPHFVSFAIGGNSHPSNIKIDFKRINEEKRYFQYAGTITDGSGRERHFLSPRHCWLDRVSYDGWQKIFGVKVKKKWTFYPDTWTPFQLPIIEERLPNGNLLCYDYVQLKKEKEGFPYPRALAGITAYNSTKSKKIASLTFQYTKGDSDSVTAIHVQGSDGREVHYQNTANAPYKLLYAEASGKPKIRYDYCKQAEKPKGFRETGTGQLQAISKPQGILIKTEYDHETRVQVQYAPVGPKGELHPIHRYQYFQNRTEIIDGEGFKTEYHFDDDKRLHKIFAIKENHAYRTIHFDWDLQTKDLRAKVIKDSRNQVVHHTEYTYDSKHNIIEERVGNGDEWRIVKRTYSADGLNLRLSESDRPEKIVRYHYLSGTDLISSEFTYENETIRKRIFHFYDDCAVCVKTIIDDGWSESADSLEGVTYRKVRLVTPKATHPCFGLPEIVEEKTINDQGKEIGLRKVIYTYAPSGKILEEAHYDADGKYIYSIYNEYDEQERLIVRSDPVSAVMCYTYDENHNLIAIAGPRQGQYSEIGYDKANRPVRMTSRQNDGTVLISEKKYNTLGQVITECDPSGNCTYRDYDLLGNLIATYYPDGAIERREVDCMGNVIKEISPMGEVTRYEYNPFGQPMAIYYPDGSEEHFTYNGTGTLHSHCNQHGATTVYTYDIFDHLIKSETRSIVGRLMKTSSAKWNAFTKISEEEGDLLIQYEYDFAGRKIKEQKDQEIITYSYNSQGYLEKKEQAGIIEEKKYDHLGRVTYLAHRYQGVVQQEKSYRYDLSGNCSEVRTFRGTNKSFFDTENRLILMTDEEGYKTEYFYSTNPKMQTIVEPNGLATVISYDVRGREKLRCKKNAKQQVIQQAESFYNKNGDPISLIHTVFSGYELRETITHKWEYGPMHRIARFIEGGERETRYEYDDRGRLERIIEADGAELVYDYDELGRVKRFFSRDFEYIYSYDERDRLCLISDRYRPCTARRSYDPLGHILTEDFGNGMTISYQYDTLGRKKEATLYDGSTIFYDYEGLFLKNVRWKEWKHTYKKRNLVGDVEEAETKVGRILTTRDRRGAISSITAPSFHAYQYRYNEMGELLSYCYEDAKGCAQQEYGYDDLGQLIKENKFSYECDSIHNRLKKNEHHYLLSRLSEVREDGEKVYRYDRSGNLIQEGARRYSYDKLHRIISVQEGGTRIEYRYDSFHRRISKMVFPKGKGCYEIFYIWDGNEEIGSVHESGERLELRILGEGLGAEIGAAVFMEIGGKGYVPIHDHRGSLVSLLDPESKKSIATYRYSAFGEMIEGDELSPWRFSSKRWDKESGLYFFGRRYYHAGLGRWMTKDPEGFKDGPNLYAYLHHSPLTKVDLYGLEGYWSSFSHSVSGAVEWFGANIMVPSPGRTIVESIGRWGAGGDFFGGSRYRTPRNEVISIPGISVAGYSLTHGNGMATTRNEAIAQAEAISHFYGGVQVDLLYQGTQGLMMDLMNCLASKCTMKNSYNKMSAAYFHEKLVEDASHHFVSSVHSRGGIQMKNTGALLQDWERKSIYVNTFGSATIISKDYFANADNYVNCIDIVPWTSPIGYCLGIRNDKYYNVHRLQSKTKHPVKAHSLMEETYAEKIEDLGKKFQGIHLAP